jgi:hypothetical protein
MCPDFGGFRVAVAMRCARQQITEETLSQAKHAVWTRRLIAADTRGRWASRYCARACVAVTDNAELKSVAPSEFPCNREITRGSCARAPPPRSAQVLSSSAEK